MHIITSRKIQILFDLWNVFLPSRATLNEGLTTDTYPKAEYFFIHWSLAPSCVMYTFKWVTVYCTQEYRYVIHRNDLNIYSVLPFCVKDRIMERLQHCLKDEWCYEIYIRAGFFYENYIEAVFLHNFYQSSEVGLYRRLCVQCRNTDLPAWQRSWYGLCHNVVIITVTLLVTWPIICIYDCILIYVSFHVK